MLMYNTQPDCYIDVLKINYYIHDSIGLMYGL